MDDGAGAIAGLITLLLTIFGIILAVLMMLLPFYVLRIRREVIEINVKLGDVCKLLGHGVQKPPQPAS